MRHFYSHSLIVNRRSNLCQVFPRVRVGYHVFSDPSRDSPTRLTATCTPTALPYNTAVFTFIETKLFTRLVQDYLTGDEYRELQTVLIERPEADDVIPGTGGARKLRWRAPGRGKRGGYRVIYYLKTGQDEI